jgi:sodium transport system permease protein
VTGATTPPRIAPKRGRQALIVVRKELRDSFRDRRALFSIFFSAIFFPIVITVMMNRVADRARDAEHITIPVAGADNAPALIDWLQQQDGVALTDAPADPEAAVRDKSVDVVLIIPKNYAERFSASRSAPLRLVSDGSNNTAQPAVNRVRQLLAGYSGQIASLRLIARGVSPVIASPLQLQEIEVSSAQQRAAAVLSFIPLMLMIAAFTGGMQIATDSTAGERERGSLEPLLVNPVARSVLVTGKWLAAACAAMLSVGLTTGLSVAQLQLVPLQDLGIRFTLGPNEVLGMLAAVLPLCPLTAAVQTYIGTYARSFKEAQSYMGVLISVMMLPALLSSLYPIADRVWMYPVPVIGQYLLLTAFLGGRAPGVLPFALSAVSALALAVVFVQITTRLFRNERIIFAR